MTRSTVAMATACVILTAALGAGCGRNKAPVLNPAPPPPETTTTDAVPPTPPPPRPVAEPVIVPPEPVRDDRIASASLDDLNRNSPLKPVFFELDSSEVSAGGRSVLDENAAVLKRYTTWVVTIEGHCDERGTAEYNLALGERRALAARAYLVSQGIAADRLRTVSYGKEFPFDPGHDEGSFSKNRRAHFVSTAR